MESMEMQTKENKEIGRLSSFSSATETAQLHPDVEQIESIATLRATADVQETKHDILLKQWHEIRESLSSDVENNLQRQDHLIAFLLKMDFESEVSAPPGALPSICTDSRPKFRSARSMPKLSAMKWSPHQSGDMMPPAIRNAWDRPVPIMQSNILSDGHDQSDDLAKSQVTSAKFSSGGKKSEASQETSMASPSNMSKIKTLHSTKKICTAKSFRNWEYSEKHAQFVTDHQNELQKVVHRFQRQGGKMSAQFDKALGSLVTHMNADEPTRTGCMLCAIESRCFHILCTAVIVFDSIFTAYCADYSMNNFSTEQTTFMRVVDILLVLFYFSEVCMKLAVHRLFFFTNSEWPWNLFDFGLVVQGIIDVILTQAVDEDVANVQFMRLIRLLKIGKVFRLVRAVRFFQDLRIMVKSIVFSVGSMFWAFVMFALILYIAALFFVQTMSGYMAQQHQELSDDTKDKVQGFFGSVGKAALSLYQSASGGIDWETIYNVVELSGPLSSMGFIFFIWFFNFAVLNILSGIFIEKAMVASIPDREQIALQKRRQEEKDAKELTELIASMDVKGTGTITLDQFLVQAHDEYANAYLKTLEISIDDATLLFNLLRSVVGTGELPIKDFVQKLVKIKGTAKALDLQSLAFEVSVIRQMVSDLIGSFSEGMTLEETEG